MRISLSTTSFILSGMMLLASIVINTTSVVQHENLVSNVENISDEPEQNAQPKNKFSARQTQLLEFAKNIARDVGIDKPEILQGIIYQESKAGGMKSFRVAGHEFGLKEYQRYYGVSQIKLSAAKDVLKYYPYLYNKYKFHTKTDDEVIANLILNDEFNIEVASLYLKIIADFYNNDPSYMIAAFNKGPSGAKRLANIAGLEYVIKVKEHVKRFFTNSVQ